jgi:hypothetical protein
MDPIEIESAKKSLDTIMDFVRRIGGPAADEFGIFLGNNFRAWRLTNAYKIFEKTKRKLAEAGLPPNALPPRLFLPLMDAASVEDDESLQEMWASLLTTAMLSPDAVPPSFVETLKQMTPEEAVCIDKVYGDRTNPNNPHRMPLNTQLGVGMFRDSAGTLRSVFIETYERLGIICREYGLTREGGKTEVGSLLRFTKYGRAFLEACHGPQGTGE